MEKGCTIDNFWNASIGVWAELYSIPDGFELFNKSENSNSWYYTNENRDVVIRLSDHWGSGIGQCNWYLDGYKRCNSFKWSEVCGDDPVRIGVIILEHLIDVSQI